MEKVNVHSLYSRFKKNIHKKPYQIIGTMKSLALSTDDYSNFYNSAKNIFHRTTFKLPNETSYPILKKSQSKYISLKSKLNTFSFKDKKYEPKDLSIPFNKKIKYIFSEEKKNKYKRKKNINFFICDNNYGRTVYNKFYDNNNNNKYKFFRNTKFHPPDFYKNFTSFKNIYPVEEIKNPEERIKDFFMFLNSIFIKESYNNLKYEENEIFGHKDDYLHYIKDEFNYFYQKEKEVDKKSFLYNNFKTKDYGNVELYLKSARIDIIDESSRNNKVKLSIYIPFSLMTFIYLVNIEQMNQILFYLLNKLNINEKINILPEEESTKLFLDILSQIKYENNKIIFNLINKNYERYNSKIYFLEKIQEISEGIRYNYFLSDFYKKPEIIKINENSHHHVHSSINSINKKRIIFYNNMDYYKISLISKKDNKYSIKLIMPEISMLFIDYEKELNHCINKEIFIYLYQNNFMDWDFYILHYLFSRKNFRIFICSVLSLKNNINLFLSKKIINLKKSKIEFPLNNTNKLDKDIKLSSSINNFYKKYYLSNYYSSKNCITEIDIEFIYSYLNKDNLYFCKFKSYILFAFFNNINKPFIYEFNFNFKQMKILYFRSLFKNFDLFMKRLLYLKNDIIYLDYSNFENFYTMTNKEIYQFFFKLNQNNDETNINNEDLKINSLMVKIREPHIEIISKDKQNDKYDQYYIDIEKNFLKVFCNREVNEWNKIIEENKNLFEVNNYKKYEDIKVKKRKKKIFSKGKKKDFQSAFMNFLRISTEKK